MTRLRSSHRSLSQSGFTLLEVVVAFAVLALASTGILYMGTISTTGNTRSQDEAAAVSLAVDKLEQLKNSGFAATCSSPNPETLGIFSRLCSVGTQYTLTGEPAKDFTVTVQWTGGGSVALTTTLINPTTMTSGSLQQFPTVAVKSWSSQ
jgi:prepilin-type N-terminal cleavage/methylation domain-containing protein